MKIVKGPRWLERDFIEQLTKRFGHNHTADLNKFVNFEGREQFIKNMLSRGELSLAQDNDLVEQEQIDEIRRTEKFTEVKYQNRLKKEEKELEEKINGV